MLSFDFILFWLVVLCMAVSLLKDYRRFVRLSNRIDCISNDVAALRSEKKTQGDRHAAAMIAIANKLESVETLAKRRTRR